MLTRSAVWLLVLGACDREPVPGDGSDGWSSGDDRPTLEVAVEEADGTPVVGAWAVLSPSGRDAQAAEDGVASFAMLAAGTYEVSVSAPGFDLESVGATVDAADLTVDVVLEPLEASPTGARGTVTSPSGQPVEGATVSLGGVDTTTDAGGAWTLEVDAGTMAFAVEPPAGTLLPWSSPRVEVAQGGQTLLDVVLPGSGRQSSFQGSQACSGCHSSQTTQHQSHPHVTGARSPGELEDTPGQLQDLVDAVAASMVIDMDNGGALHLSRTSGGGSGSGSTRWHVRIEDASGASTDDLEVQEIYGGFIAGAAFAVEAGGTWAVAPAAFGLAGGGASSAQHEAGYVDAWTDGWFDASGNLDLDGSGAPGAAASFDLQCAGCHATGHGLSESGGLFELADHPEANNYERVVGCEACHGPAHDHMAGSGDVDLILNPALLPAWQQVEVCARCHERVDEDDHPFSAAPGWVVDGDGDGLLPWEMVADHSTPDHVEWLEVSASAVPFDKVGDLRLSPHQRGPEGYAGQCSDCHHPHGSEHPSSLRVDPTDNTLCTACHASTFPDEGAQADHAGHSDFDPGEWSPGTCTGCHMPRTATVLRPDAVSGAGETHSHTLEVWSPEAAVAEFDAAGTDTLALGSVPTSSCVDCHRQAKALADEEGGVFAGPSPGDPTRQSTYESLGATFDALFGGAR